MDAILGTKVKIPLTYDEPCEHCHGSGAEDESSITTCPYCGGSGYVTTQNRTIFGMMQSQSPCSHCGGTGKIIKNKCHECGGAGYTRVKKDLTVNIPAGINNGQQIRVAGKGGRGINGGPNGDLYLEYVVSEHDYYIRENDDIYLEVPITITEAILGCKKMIPTLYGNVKLTIPAGTDSGEKQKIKGKGVNNEYRRHKGDMYVIFKVYTPKKLNKEQKSLIDKLSQTDLSTKEVNEFDRFVTRQ